MPVRLRLGNSSGEKRIKKTRISGLAGFINWVARALYRRRCRTESDFQSGRVFDLLPESIKKNNPADVNRCADGEALSDATGLPSCLLKILFSPVPCAKNRRTFYPILCVSVRVSRKIITGPSVYE